MFTFEELCQLIGVVAESKVAGLEVERDGVHIRIEGVPPAPQALASSGGTTLLPPQMASASATLPPAPTPSSAPPSSAAGRGAGSEDGEEAGLAFVTSPIVGTFYRSPNPDADPYVKVGDRVEKGQVLCIVEAMKLMNEIESDVSGTIARIYPENAQPVEFGERLFAIRSA